MPFCTLQEAWGNDFETFANPSSVSAFEAEAEDVAVAEAVAEVESESDGIMEVAAETVATTMSEFKEMPSAYDTIQTDMDLMNKKIDSIIRRLERHTAPQDFFNKNIHDIILFVIFGLFLILVLDGMYKILLLKLTGFK